MITNVQSEKHVVLIRDFCSENRVMEDFEKSYTLIYTKTASPVTLDIPQININPPECSLSRTVTMNTKSDFVEATINEVSG